ncbi:MAG TPA: thioredoxin family protein [Parafilimonas sp.]|nr:thioredoxin family protein [Parafilimonas sp.]
MKKIFLISFCSVVVLSTLSSFKLTSPAGYKIGDKAEDFALKNVDGKMVSLKDYRNVKGYIVVFTCNHCPFAKAYEERIIELHKKYAPLGYPVVAINPNNPQMNPEDSYEMMQARAKEKAYPFAYLFDEKQQVYPKFGATRTPHVFLLTKDLSIAYIGAIDDNSQDPSAVKNKYVENAITALEKGEQPNPAVTKAIGCSIK